MHLPEQYERLKQFAFEPRNTQVIIHYGHESKEIVAHMTTVYRLEMLFNAAWGRELCFGESLQERDGGRL
jgi:hypothetical protein